MNIGDTVRVVMPLDPREGQIGTVVLVSVVEGETWYNVRFADKSVAAYEACDLRRA